MSRAGTTCQTCGKKYHNCGSCGNEAWMYEYCSKTCLERAGMIECHECHGWGCAWDPDLPADHPQQEGNPQCVDGMVDLRDVTDIKDREWLHQPVQESTPTSAPAADASLKRAIGSPRRS